MVLIYFFKFVPPFSRAVHYFSRGTTPNIFRQNNAFRNVVFVKIAQLFEMFSIFVLINQVFMDETGDSLN